VVRWKERVVRAELAEKERMLLESAKREAQTLVREARVAADEQALQRRAEVEQQIAARQQELSTELERFREREAAVKRQSEETASREQVLRDCTARCEKQQAELTGQRAAATELLKQRRAELSAISKLTETEVRTAFLKDIENESLHDAMQLSHHIVEEAGQRPKKKPAPSSSPPFSATQAIKFSRFPHRRCPLTMKK